MDPERSQIAVIVYCARAASGRNLAASFELRALGWLRFEHMLALLRIVRA
jgi:hypothetical protein